ncbi:MAG: Flp family type IVb pilin [Pirellulales bacterium]
MKIRTFLHGDDGPTAVEYAVMLALVAAVTLASVRLIGVNSSRTFNRVGRSIRRANR